MTDNRHYTGRLTPQHRRPKLVKWLDACITPFFDSEMLTRLIDKAFELELSEGAQLDVTGDIVGRKRVLSFDPISGASPVLDDETYRLLQKAKISINNWDGTIPGVLELWENLFPDYRLFIQDNQDMTMDLYIAGFVTPLWRELIARGYAAPKPMGVLVRFTFVFEHEPLEHGLYIGGHTWRVSQSRLPPIRRETAFNAKLRIGGNTWRIAQIQLPPLTLQTGGA